MIPLAPECRKLLRGHESSNWRDGWLVWTVNRPVPEVLFFVGRVANHSLTLKGKQYRLLIWWNPGLRYP